MHVAIHEGFRRGLGKIPVARHVRRRGQANLPHLVRRKGRPVLPYHLHPHPREGLPCGLHALGLARGVVVPGRQVGGRARGFRHAIELGEAALKHRDRFPEQVEGDGRGAIEHGFDAGEIRFRAARVLEAQAHGRGDDEQLGDAFLLDHLKDAPGFKFREHDVLRPGPHPLHAPAGASNVEAGHGD